MYECAAFDSDSLTWSLLQLAAGAGSSRVGGDVNDEASLHLHCGGTYMH